MLTIAMEFIEIIDLMKHKTMYFH